MTTIYHGSPSAHAVVTLELRIDPKSSHCYDIYVDDIRLATVFGLDGKLPRLVVPIPEEGAKL